MKTIITVSLLLIGVLGHSQNKNAKFYELHERVAFYEVNKFYKLEKDTIFHSPVNFWVYSAHDTIVENKHIYYVFSYPNFEEGGKSYSIQSEYAQKDTLAKGKSVHQEIFQNINGDIKKIEHRLIAIKKDNFEKVKKIEVYRNRFFSKNNRDFTMGILTAPFKLRPKINDTTSFSMSTDVSLGPYLGYRTRISKYKEHYFTITATAGLTYVNISDNNTRLDNPDSDINLLPGVSYSYGAVLELDNFSIGILTGRDFVSNIGDDWIYHGKRWISFAIGHSFLQKKDSK